MCSQTSD
jgi:hypothetical protein